MDAYDWLVADLLYLFYNLTWLVFLTKKHYGQVTTTAGHIFEASVKPRRILLGEKLGENAIFLTTPVPILPGEKLGEKLEC